MQGLLTQRRASIYDCYRLLRVASLKIRPVENALKSRDLVIANPHCIGYRFQSKLVPSLHTLVIASYTVDIGFLSFAAYTGALSLVLAGFPCIYASDCSDFHPRDPHFDDHTWEKLGRLAGRMARSLLLLLWALDMQRRKD